MQGLSDQKEESNSKIDETAGEGGLGCIGTADTQILAQQFVSRRLTHDRQAAVKATRRCTNSQTSPLRKDSLWKAYILCNTMCLDEAAAVIVLSWCIMRW
jgi:hypothetical protein